MVVKISGKRMLLWRAVDDEGEVLDVLVQKRRNTKAAMRLFRKLLKNTGVRPECISTDRLASYRAAARGLGISRLHRPGRMIGNNRAENSHLPIRRASANNRSSNRNAQLRGSFPLTPKSTTPSIFNVT
jgi:transposase-like protein